MDSAAQIGARVRRDLTLARLAELQTAAVRSPFQQEAANLAALQTMVQHARDHVPFYQRSLAALPDPFSYDQVHDLLDDLPVLNRSDLQDSQEDMRFRHPADDPSAYVESSTSGSTGKPVSVLKHGPSYAVDFDATTLLDWLWHKRPLDTTVAMFRLVDQEGDGPLGPPLSYLGHQAIAHWRSIAHRTPAEMVDLMHAVTADLVFCNGVVLRQLCLEQRDSPRPDVRLSRFVSVSDRIDPQLRALARETFGAVIEDRYSSEELGYLALQCPGHEHLHIMGDDLVLEVVDANGLPCSPGEPGRVLVTSLRSWTQPLLRYDIGDIATLGEPCDSGITWPVLDRVEGRIRDGVTLADGNFHLVSFHGTTLMSAPRLREYVCALFDNAIVVLLDSDGELSAAVQEQIRADVAASFALDLPVSIRRTATRIPFPSAKRREWYRTIGRYTPEMTEEQVWAALRR